MFIDNEDPDEATNLVSPVLNLGKADYSSKLIVSDLQIGGAQSYNTLHVLHSEGERDTLNLNAEAEIRNITVESAGGNIEAYGFYSMFGGAVNTYKPVTIDTMKSISNSTTGYGNAQVAGIRSMTNNSTETDRFVFNDTLTIRNLYARAPVLARASGVSLYMDYSVNPTTPPGAVFMAPVSSVGYAISLEQDVAGTNGETVTSLFQGEGGLSKVGISVAHQLWKGLSLGANFSYVGGTITQSESQGSATETNSSYKHTVYVDFGLQYTYEIERDRSLVAGAVYGYSQDLLQDNDHSVSSSSSSGSITEKGKKYRTCLPQFFGVGVSYNTLRWMASADYKFVDWSRLESSRSSVSFHNQHRLMLGGSYTLGNPYRKPVRLLLGAGIGNSYLSIQNKTTTNYYLSTGINFEYRSRSTLSLGVKYTDQFKVSSGRFQGQKLAFFLNITFSEKTYRAKLK